MMITVPTIGEPRIVASAAKLPRRDCQLDLVGTGRRANWTKVNARRRADHQRATMFKSSLTSEIIRFMFEPASCR